MPRPFGTMSEYQTLDEGAIVRTVEVLHRRVSERFPTRGLTQTAAFLVELSKKSAREARELRRPNWLLRAAIAAILFSALYGLYALRVYIPELSGGSHSLSEFAQGLEASFNIVALSGLIILFLVSLETRYKRRRALNALYRLRALSHVIDMHQLTKEPASVIGTERTGSSPTRDLTNAQLLRYLDYCAEMQAMIGKLAALYAQDFPNQTVISAVNDIEDLTNTLSRKIWQKIAVAQREERG